MTNQNTQELDQFTSLQDMKQQDMSAKLFAGVEVKSMPVFDHNSDMPTTLMDAGQIGQTSKIHGIFSKINNFANQMIQSVASVLEKSQLLPAKAGSLFLP